jgi:hypothetical protein
MKIKQIKNGEIQTKIREIQTIKTDFLFGFPGLLKESGKPEHKNNKLTKSKQKSGKIWISPILCFGIPDFSLDFADFYLDSPDLFLDFPFAQYKTWVT